MVKAAVRQDKYEHWMAVEDAVAVWWHALDVARRPRTVTLADLAVVLNMPVDRQTRTTLGLALRHFGFRARLRRVAEGRVMVYEPSLRLTRAGRKESAGAK